LIKLYRIAVASNTSALFNTTFQPCLPKLGLTVQTGR